MRASPLSNIPVLPQIARLNALISLLLGNLSAGDRMKIMTICTIDVHARDVVAKMIQTKVFGTRGNFCCTISQTFGPQDSCHSITLGLGCGLAPEEEWSSPSPAQPWDPLHTLLVLEQPRGRACDCPRGQVGQCQCPPALHTRLLRRWRTPRRLPGSRSCGTAGMRGRSTALPTSATPSSCTPTSTWGTPPGWSSPP